MRKKPRKRDDLWLRNALTGVQRVIKDTNHVELDQAAHIMCAWLINYSIKRDADDLDAYIYNFMDDLGLLL